MKIEPICLPIYSDLKECLFQSDTHIIACKEEINELTFCENNPTEYVQFLRASTPRQRLPKKYDFHQFNAKFDYNWLKLIEMDLIYQISQSHWI